MEVASMLPVYLTGLILPTLGDKYDLTHIFCVELHINQYLVITTLYNVLL
jgi:hypothetical protein